MAEHETGPTETSTSESTPSAPLYKVAAVVLAGAGLVVGYVSVKGKPPAHLEHAPAGQAASAPARHAPCVEAETIYRRMQAALGCPSSYSDLAKAMCEATYEQKKACIDEFEAALACIRAEPQSAWQCDVAGKLNLKEASCSAQSAALRSCFLK